MLNKTLQPNLPVIVPVVVYHGAGRWRVASHFSALFDLQADDCMAKYLPDFGYELENLQAAQEQELRQRAVLSHVKAALWFLKSARNGQQLLQQMQQWHGVLRTLLEQPSGMGAFMTLMRYYMSVSQGTQLQQVQRQLTKVLGPKSREGLMTLAETLRKEGRVEGKAEGKAEGRAEGKAEGRVEGRAEGKAVGKLEGEIRALLTLFEARGWRLTRTQRQKIRMRSDLSVLEQWLRRAAVASCLREVFCS
ncbi:MAG: Rpn family recombination-promoting nuclease/putative transposase [Myxococcota bacterium]